MVTGEDGTESELMAAYPLREEVEALTEMSGTLNRPMVQNRVVWNIYQEEAHKYLEGSTDAEEAAGKYRAESGYLSGGIDRRK